MGLQSYDDLDVKLLPSLARDALKTPASSTCLSVVCPPLLVLLLARFSSGGIEIGRLSAPWDNGKEIQRDAWWWHLGMERGKLAGFGSDGLPSGVVIVWRRGCPALRRPDGDL